MKYKDEEWISLRNRLVIGVFFILVFCIPIVYLWIHKFGVNDSSLIKKINQKETFLLYTTEKNCKSCQKLEKIIKEKKIEYSKINKTKDRNYLDILQKLNQEDQIPSLYYIVEGEVYSFLEKPTEEELEEYLNQLLGGEDE